MKLKLIWLSLVAVALMFGATNLAAKSGAADGIYTVNDLEYYLTPEDLLFIRPGLVATVLDVTLPADGQLEVTFSITDPAGLPLDNTGVNTPGAVDFRFTLANYPAGSEQKHRIAYERDSRNGTLTTLGDGEYKYKFDYVMDTDPDTTHTLVLGFRRDLRDFGLDRYAGNDIYNWVPSGMSTPTPRDVVTTETCMRCHNPYVPMHGGRWLSVEACGQCHNPAMTEEEGGPRSLDDMIHQVHAGPNLETPLVIGSHDYSLLGMPEGAEYGDCELCHTGGTPTADMPLVATPNPVPVCDMTGRGSTTLNWGSDIGPFEIHYESPEGATKLFTKKSGTSAGAASINGWLRDGAKFKMVDASGKTIQRITVNTTALGCVGAAPGSPRGMAGEQHTNWMTRPSRRVCGSCHDNVNFETGEGHSAGNYPMRDDSLCYLCHVPDSGKEFDASVAGAHQQVYKSAQLPGVIVKLLEVTNTDPGDNPTVTFKIGDKYGPIDPNTLDRLRFVITGPNTDFEFYLQEEVADDADAVAQGGGVWAYTFVGALPMDAMGSYTVSFEGRNEVEVNMITETSEERDVAQASLLAFAVTDSSAMPRRQIVDDAKCEACHTNVAGHGGGRTNADYCTTCHNPTLIDIADVPESVNMKWMIHKIHRGAELDNGYVVIRSRGTYDFSHVEYPSDLRNCDQCHVNDSQLLPLPSTAASQITPNFWWDPIDPVAAACLGCHDSDSAAVHAYSNTTFFGESCSTCHGEGKGASVTKVHAH